MIPELATVFAERLEAIEAERQDLAALVRQLCAKVVGLNSWKVKAQDYLKRKGLEGSILR